jgi:transcriptional regulator with GAF, ATPase, and Fis domain
MKKKPLTYYLDLIKSARTQHNWVKAKHYGELAVKKLPSLSYSPLEEYILYANLGHTYHDLAEFSRALDMCYKAYLIASKDNLDEERLIFVSFLIGSTFLALNNFNQALPQFQKVEQYYHKRKDIASLTKVSLYLNTLIGLGFCYICQNNLPKARELIEKKIDTLLSSISNDLFLKNYYHLKGEFLTESKEYDKARQAFEECVKISTQLGFINRALESTTHLAILDLMEGKLESAIELLQNVLKESQRLKFSKTFCEAGLLLIKCYTLKNQLGKAVAMEKRIKSVLNKLDIIWLYEKTRQFEQLYRHLQDVYKTEFNPIPIILSRTLSGHYGASRHKDIVIGQSNSMQEIYQLIEKVAPTDLPILIQGETGTGKELITRIIHQNSLREGKPLAALNCSAMPETLLENALFGHVKGAFTDAIEDRRGYIEVASESTLLLDEVSEMSPAMQQKLLRVLEEKQVWRLGAEKPVPVNTRFIFASNQNIEELVKNKRFRLDLFHRINTIIITVPPLRDRKEDIPLLINHFLAKYSRPSSLVSAHSSLVPRFSPDALTILVNYNWFGNVRELENEIKRICALYPRLNDSRPNAEVGQAVGQADTKLITETMLSENIRGHLPEASSKPKEDLSLSELKEMYERNLIIETLRKCNGNMSKAAQALKCDRANLHKRIRQLKINIS